MYPQIHTHLCIRHGVQTRYYVKAIILMKHWQALLNKAPSTGGKRRNKERERERERERTLPKSEPEEQNPKCVTMGGK
jgi:hypothetical protein